MGFLDHKGIGTIQCDRVVIYACIVVDYQAPKRRMSTNYVRITAGGNLFKDMYPDELTTRTSDLTLSKYMWNIVISTPSARYTCTDASDIYLVTPLEHYQYMNIPVHLIPRNLLTFISRRAKSRMVLYIARLFAACIDCKKQEY